jgi:hypothetical protein
LSSGKDCRIVHVSSEAHNVPFDFDAFDIKAVSSVKFLEWTQYCNSKLLQILFSKAGLPDDTKK